MYTRQRVFYTHYTSCPKQSAIGINKTGSFLPPWVALFSLSAKKAIHLSNENRRLNELPPWNDNDFNVEDQDRESWKPNPTRDDSKAMYQQWNMVMTLLRAAFGSLPEARIEDDILTGKCNKIK